MEQEDRKAGPSLTGGNSGLAAYAQRTAAGDFCRGKEETGWYATLSGTIVYGGRTYYARVCHTADSLFCGG